MAESKARRAAQRGAEVADIGERKQARQFRFFDNREKYLLFVTTCSEKWVVAERIGRELRHLHPSPPALRVFDAGIGDGTVLTRVLRHIHRRFPTVPLFVVAKEISLEDVRLCLAKLADRFVEHPQTVYVVTNMYYGSAPALIPASAASDASLNWYDVALRGTTSHEFDEQILGLQPQLAEGWRSQASPKTGNMVYLRPSVMVIYREDQAFTMKSFIPSRGGIDAAYDLIVASQPYRARLPAEVKARKVLAPLARALAPGGRMIVIQGYGHDPGMEIINRLWPDDQPFATNRHVMLDALRKQIGRSLPDLRYQAYSDARSLFRYELHTLPTEVDATISTSTLMAAWNAAVYVAQIEDERVDPVLADGRYMEATREVLRKRGGLWFNDESFIVARKRA